MENIRKKTSDELIALLEKVKQVEHEVTLTTEERLEVIAELHSRGVPMGELITLLMTEDLLRLIEKQRHVGDYPVVLTQAQKKQILYEIFFNRYEENLIPDNIIDQIVWDILPIGSEYEANFYLADILTEDRGNREKWNLFTSEELVHRFRSHMVAKLEPNVSVKYAKEIFGELRRRVIEQDADKEHVPYNIYSLKRSSSTHIYVWAMLAALPKEKKRWKEEEMIRALITVPLFDPSSND